LGLLGQMFARVVITYFAKILRAGYLSCIQNIRPRFGESWPNVRSG
jgi:hypothetical protein